MKILTIDIERRPSLAHVWGLWNQNISTGMVQDWSSTISWAAKWHGAKKVEFMSDYHDGHNLMIERAHELLSEADAVVTYNGSRFDLPHLNREFILQGLNPPEPYADIDLIKTVKRQFKFDSNKLAHVTEQLGLAQKMDTGGFDLWIGCMQNDPKSWATMKKYNIQDVKITEELYDKLLPWIKNHPNVGLYDDNLGGTCPRCDSNNVTKQGHRYTAQGKYPRFQCSDCHGWFTGTKSVEVRSSRNI